MTLRFVQISAMKTKCYFRLSIYLHSYFPHAQPDFCEIRYSKSVDAFVGFVPTLYCCVYRETVASAKARSVPFAVSLRPLVAKIWGDNEMRLKELLWDAMGLINL